MAEDRKFKFEDGRFINRVSGMSIPDDESVMLFRARDKHALGTLLYYRSLVQDPHHAQAVEDRIREFATWRVDNQDQLKEPGITRSIVLNSEQTYCSLCGKPQYETPSGITCSNGHGGADSK